jgi:hypothetical protein
VLVRELDIEKKCYMVNRVQHRAIQYKVGKEMSDKTKKRTGAYFPMGSTKNVPTCFQLLSEF